VEQLNNRAATLFLKYAIGIAILALLIWRYWDPAQGTGLRVLWQEHVIEGEPLHYHYFAAAFVVVLFGVLQTFVRWGYLVRAIGLPFTTLDALRLGFVGFYYNMALPSSVGGDLIKAYYMAREHDRRTMAIATIIVDRIVGLWALFWLVSVSGTIFWSSGKIAGAHAATGRFIITAAFAIVIASLVIWVAMSLLSQQGADRFACRLARIPRIGGPAAEAWRAIWMYRVAGKTIWIALLMAIMGHVAFVLGFHFSALTLYDSTQVPDLANQFLVVPIAMAAQAGIPTPGGLGGGEWIISLLYPLIGYPGQYGAFMWFTDRVITWIVGFIGYLIHIQMKPSMPAELSSTSA
jgi:glycosyltransferase 2 family protein